MGRILKILVYAVILFFVYLWISTMIKSCGNSSDSTATTDKEMLNDEVLADDITSGDDAFFEDSESFEDDITEGEDQSEEEAIDYTEIDNTLNNTKPDSKETPISVPASSSNGRYMVIAGSYLLKSNANNMSSKLKKLGFNGAEIVVFDLSQYHSVSAGRFSNYSDAQNLANELKSRGIDCYVHSKK